MFIKTKIKGKVYFSLKKEWGYSEPSDHYEQIIWKVYYLFFIPIWFKILLIETVPSWAIIQRACLGSTDWKSSDPDLIDSINN